MHPVTRRDVLRGTATVLMAKGCSPAILANNQPASRDEQKRPRALNAKKVVIAGGGLAGLCCAYSRRGELRQIWPLVTEAVGRVHFAGAYTDNLRWGVEAACRSANRAAEAMSNG